MTNNSRARLRIAARLPDLSIVGTFYGDKPLGTYENYIFMDSPFIT